MFFRYFLTLTTFFLSIAFANCQAYEVNGKQGQAGDSLSYQTPFLEMRSDPSPFQISGNYLDNFSGDVSYSQFASNVFDIWMAKSTTPTPLVIFYHGGGFTSGDKSVVYGKVAAKRSVNPDFVNKLLSEGISFASINYRLIGQNEKEGVLKSLNDSKRALQYIKYHSELLNIDPDKIALIGSSAGAGTSLWIATNDDLKDEAGADPVASMSTRVSAIALNETQSTYDIERWFGDVFPIKGSFKSLEGSALEKKLLPFYGINSIAQLESPDMENYREKVDMLSMITSDDPPIWLRNGQEFKEKNGRPGNLFHSPYHALAIKKAVDAAAGIENYIYIPAAQIEPDSQISMIDFLIRELKN